LLRTRKKAVISVLIIELIGNQAIYIQKEKLVEIKAIYMSTNRIDVRKGGLKK
jgi:hypothetical protein